MLKKNPRRCLFKTITVRTAEWSPTARQRPEKEVRISDFVPNSVRKLLRCSMRTVTLALRVCTVPQLILLRAQDCLKPNLPRGI
jgi:hypothetical protein